MLNLTRAIQISVDIGAHIIASSEERPPVSMGDTFVTLRKLGILDEDTAIRMRKSVGFRNIAVHGYDDINFSIVYSIITTQLDDFNQFARAVSANLKV